MADDSKTYALEGSTLRKLEGIKRRLYEPQPLTPDERRDLANRMDAVLREIVPIP